MDDSNNLKESITDAVLSEFNVILQNGASWSFVVKREDVNDMCSFIKLLVPPEVWDKDVEDTAQCKLRVAYADDLLWFNPRSDKWLFDPYEFDYWEEAR